MSRAPQTPDGWSGPGDGTPKALRLVLPPEVCPRRPRLFPFSRAVLIAGVVLSMGVCAGALIWTVQMVAPPEMRSQVPVVVVEPVMSERPEPEEPQERRVEAVVEALPPAPRQMPVPLLAQVEKAELPSPDAEVFDGEPLDSARVEEEPVREFIEVEKKTAPPARKPSATRKSAAPQRVVRKAAPVRKAATLVRRIQPVYPTSARRAGVEGRVLLQVAVRSDGKVGDVSLAGSSGSGLLDSAAIRAVRKWAFHPATLDGRAIASMVRVPVRFELR